MTILSGTFITTLLTQDGNLCTSHFNIKSLKWTKVNRDVIAGNITGVKMLESRGKQFASLLASSQMTNKTLIYQVSMKSISWQLLNLKKDCTLKSTRELLFYPNYIDSFTDERCK